jgi:hypothetical protein
MKFLKTLQQYLRDIDLMTDGSFVYGSEIV